MHTWTIISAQLLANYSNKACHPSTRPRWRGFHNSKLVGASSEWQQAKHVMLMYGTEGSNARLRCSSPPHDAAQTGRTMGQPKTSKKWRKGKLVMAVTTELRIFTRLAARALVFHSAPARRARPLTYEHPAARHTQIQTRRARPGGAQKKIPMQDGHDKDSHWPKLRGVLA
jgi:hypothetical protein